MLGLPYFSPKPPASPGCPGCGVASGSKHEWGCQNEQCPFCGDKLDGCGCIFIPRPNSRGLNPLENEDFWQEIVDERGRIPFGSEDTVAT